MNPSIKSILFAIFIITLQGCGNTTIQRYSTTTPLTLSDNSQTTGVLFWDKQEGSIWYGANLKKTPPVVRLALCNSNDSPKSFNTTIDEERLVIYSKRGDTLKFEVNSQGELQQVSRNAHGSFYCAQLWLKGKPATPFVLTHGSKPNLFITCSSTNPNRYPKAGKYLFDRVTKQLLVDPEKPFSCSN